MIDLTLNRVRSVLCIGAHADDIEIGCGGTILSLIAAVPDISIAWVVMSSSGVRETEARESASKFLRGVREPQVEICSFRDGFFPYDAGVKEHFEHLKSRHAPELILTHRREDRHQDHRTVCELTWNTFRNHLILEYEIPKWDGDLGRPNVYLPLSERTRGEKIELLMSSFASQHQKQWYESELFDALMRLRGMECGAPERFAEAFYGPKMRIVAGPQGDEN